MRGFLAFFLSSLVIVGCNCGASKTSHGTVDPGKSTVTVDRSTGVIANGRDQVTVLVSLVDTLGAPIAGQTAQLTVSGDQNVVSQPGPTGADGKSSGTLASVSVGTKQITATVGTVTLEQQPTVEFVAGRPVQLAFSTQPMTVVAGSHIQPAVQVTILDVWGRVASASSDAVTLAFGASADGSTLSGTLTVNATDGVATFPDLSIDKAGMSYSLLATSGQLTPIVSEAFDVTPAAEATLAFLTQPSDVRAGATMTPAVRVAIQDRYGNLIKNGSDSVTLAISTGATGGTLGGTATVTAVGGIATFSDLSLTKAGSGYSFQANAVGLESVTSTPFRVSAAEKSQLAFTVQPSSTQAGVYIKPPVQVAVEDPYGNLVTTATDSMVLAITAPSTERLLGVTMASASAGIANFPGLVVNHPGSYTLTATSGNLSGTSASFDVVVGAPDRAVFTTQPSNAIAGAAIAPAVQVVLQDVAGNVITSMNEPVTVSIATHAGPGLLDGTSTVNAVDGVATFNDLSIDIVGTGYTLAATANGFAGATSLPFNITSGAPSPATSTITANPTSLVADGANQTILTVTATDAHGNLIGSQPVSIAVNGSANNLRFPTGTTNSAGVFTATLASTRAELKTVTATLGAATISTSVTFVAGSPASTNTTLVADPTTVPVDGLSTALLTVKVADINGNPVKDQSVTISATGTGNTLTPEVGMTGADGAFTATLLSTKAEVKHVTAAVNLFTRFANVTFVPGPVSAQTSSVVATPSSVTADGVSPSLLTVTALDASGNPIGNQGVMLHVSGTGNTISTIVGITSAQGVFVSAVVSSVAETKTVTATVAGVPLTTTVTFIAGPPDGTRTTLTANPVNVVADGATPTTLLVTVVDRNGNPIAGQPVTLSVTGSGNTLAASSGVTDAAGTLSIALVSTKAEYKVVTAVVGAFPVTTGVTFVPGAASTATSSISVAPATQTADGLAFSTITVTLRDANGNAASGQTVSLSVSGTANVLSAAGGPTGADGLFTATLASTKAELKTITADIAAGTMTGTVQFIAGPPSLTRSSLSANPGQLRADGVSTTTILLKLVDASGNPVGNQPVTLVASGSGNTLSTTTGATDSAGVFSATLSSTVGEVKQLTVTGGPITLTTSVYFIPRFTLASGGIGTLGTRPAPVNGLQIVDDGLEFAGQKCVGSMCVSGGLVP